jgi:hypothetical protein
MYIAPKSTAFNLFYLLIAIKKRESDSYWKTEKENIDMTDYDYDF